MNSKASSPVLVNSIKRILRPLVGFLLDNGLTYTWLIKVLKSIYVEIAENEFELDGKPQTHSRVSLITGVHRKDVAELRGENKPSEEMPSTSLLSAKLIAKWTGDNRFLDGEGQPKILPRLAGKVGIGGPSFEELVDTTNKDIRPRAVFDEWLRAEIIEVDEEDKVFLKQHAFLPSRDHEQKAYFLGKNVGDHLSAARLNTSNDKPKYLERSVFYDELSLESIQKLEELSRKHAMIMLQTLNREASKLQKQDKERKDKTTSGRMNLGVYYYDQLDKDEP